jgi:N-methylhydantoinase A/oxoprolinase/acetone carboxylase beta subunit
MQDEAEDQLPRRQVYFAGEFIDTPSYRRSQLIGHFEGPAVIEEQGSTTIVLPHWSGAVLPSGEILLKRSARQ